MDRRAFLRRLATGIVATAATAVVDPEALCWTPGAKTLILPPAGGWVPRLGVRMAQAFDIAADQFPMRYDVVYGMAEIRPEHALRVQDVDDEMVTLHPDSFSFSMQDMPLPMTERWDEGVKAAAQDLANRIDQRAVELFNEANQKWTPEQIAERQENGRPMLDLIPMPASLRRRVDPYRKA